jgi:integrase
MRGDGRCFQRGKTWWIAYNHNGKEVRESSMSHKEQVAKRLLKKRHKEIQGELYIGPDEQRVKFSELLELLIEDYRVNKRKSDIELKLKHVRAHFGFDRAREVNEHRIAKYKLTRVEEGAANATINRELSAIKRAFTLAVQQKVVSKAPHIPMLREDNTREGFVEADELERIVAHLPENLKDFARFGFLTAWRRGEIATLEWRDVDLKRGQLRLRSSQSKNSKGRFLALEGDLKAVMDRRHRARPIEQSDGTTVLARYVFHRGRGQEDRIRSIRGAWQAACNNAGLPDVIFHDLRRSGVRTLTKAGVADHVAMKISGHKTPSVFKRYCIATEDDVRDALRATQKYLDDETGKKQQRGNA